MSDLEAIKARYEAFDKNRQGAEASLAAMRSADDVPVLLGVIERLRTMLIDAETEAEMQASEVERLRAEINERDRVVAQAFRVDL